MEFKARIAELKEELIALRRDFHMHPELGFQEYRTAEKVETFLKGLGLSPKRIADTGVVALIEGSSPGPVLMLRADIDALPIREENDLPYTSVNDGVMHACGHDAHTAMLLIAAKVLTEYRNRIPGTVKLVFQPNEEIAGAEKLVEQGLMKNPDVNAALGIHIWTPLPSGQIGIQSGAVMASMDVFKIVIQGRGGHTGYPESAVDPVIAASALVMDAQRIQTREISLMKPTVIMFGKSREAQKQYHSRYCNPRRIHALSLCRRLRQRRGSSCQTKAACRSGLRRTRLQLRGSCGTGKFGGCQRSGYGRTCAQDSFPDRGGR